MFDNILSNNRNSYFKKYFFEILKSRYPRNERVIERILFTLTDIELKDFGTLVSDIYETAYLKCVEDHRKSLEGIGYKVNIVADQSNDGVKSDGMHS